MKKSKAREAGRRCLLIADCKSQGERERDWKNSNIEGINREILIPVTQEIKFTVSLKAIDMLSHCMN